MTRTISTCLVKSRNRKWLVLKRAYNNRKATYTVYEPADQNDPDISVSSFENVEGKWRLFVLPLSANKSYHAVQAALEELNRVTNFRAPFADKTLTGTQAAEKALVILKGQPEQDIDVDIVFADYAKQQEAVTRPIVEKAYPEAKQARCDHGLYYRLDMNEILK
jgi:hypothetical protein